MNKKPSPLSFAFPLLLLLVSGFSVSAKEYRQPIPAPEFTQQNAEDWLQSSPLKLADLKGKVVLIDFWTFECWNCYRSFPWLNALEKELKDKPFQVIGVHSPEFPHEKNPVAVAKKMKEFELQHPVMIDNDFKYWRAMNNRYWPAFYLLDGEGNIRFRFIGETHRDTKKSAEVSRAIQVLLSELDDQ